MRENRVRKMLAAGKIPIGTMIGDVRTPAMAQILAAAGLDFVMLDLEHGTYDLPLAADIIAAARQANVTPLVRVADCQYHLISQPLDAGAQGVMVPRIETRAQVEQAVDAVRYPPLGSRGAAVTKGHNDYRKAPLAEFVQRANREVMLILQIERAQAVENIHDLLSVPGVDAALIGPNDLSLSLGVPGEVEHPRVTTAIERVLEACRQAGIVAGLHTSDPKTLRYWMERGMRLIMCSSDVHMLYAGASQIVHNLRD